MDATAIILAAGEGTRMKSNHCKVSHKILGKPMVQWIVDATIKAGCSRVVVVIGSHADEMRALIDGQSCSLNKIVDLSKAPENCGNSCCRNADAAIFNVELYKILLFPISEMNFSFRGKLRSVTKQVTYNLYDAIPVSRSMHVRIYVVQNKFDTVLRLMTELLFQLQADIY